MANNKIPDEDLAWLQAHKQSVERRTRMLKGAGVFFSWFAIGGIVPTITLSVLAAVGEFLILDILVAILAVTLYLIFLEWLGHPDNYNNVAVFGIVSGLLLSIIIASIYIAPIASISQYPISMQVFYPNHTNLTITQNCTGFTTSESGYLNGQPINLTNTTQCNLPQSMAQYEYNPFNCNISGKNITCIAALDAHVTWQGTILNVSKR